MFRYRHLRVLQVRGDLKQGAFRAMDAAFLAGNGITGLRGIFISRVLPVTGGAIKRCRARARNQIKSRSLLLRDCRAVYSDEIASQ